MYYPVCGMMHIKEPLLLIGKSNLCVGSGFTLSLFEWSFTIICLTPYNRKYNVLSASLNKTFPSFLVFQLSYAALLSIIYALVMMVVLVGLIKQIAENGFCSVSTIFLVTLAGIFIVSAIFHPQEFSCLFHGFLYFLSIPSMSMLLMIFSLTNLQNVSWGTREVKTAAPPVSQQQQAKTPADRNMFQKLIANVTSGEKMTSDYAFSFGNLFRCMCCPRSETKDDDLKFKAILERLDVLDDRMMEMTSGVSSLHSISDLPRDPEPLNVQPFSQNAHLFEGTGEKGGVFC